MGAEDVRKLIASECDDVKSLLLQKNRAYGNSALDPLRIFSKADPVEAIKVRIDDKLSRLKRGSASDEDTVQDLIGYLILLRVAEKTQQPYAVKVANSYSVEIELGGVEFTDAFGSMYVKHSADGFIRPPPPPKPFQDAGIPSLDDLPEPCEEDFCADCDEYKDDCVCYGKGAE